MTRNSNGPRHGQCGGDQESLFAAGDQLAATLTARPVIVITVGRVEYAARCPECRDWHRHISLGEKTAPCGAHYLLAPRRGSTMVESDAASMPTTCSHPAEGGEPRDEPVCY